MRLGRRLRRGSNTAAKQSDKAGAKQTIFTPKNTMSKQSLILNKLNELEWSNTVQKKQTKTSGQNSVNHIGRI